MNPIAFVPAGKILFFDQGNSIYQATKIIIKIILALKYRKNVMNVYIGMKIGGGRE